MIRFLTLALVASCYLFHPGPAAAQDAKQQDAKQLDVKQLAGTWKLTGWQVQYVGEEPREPFGAKPNGRLIIAPDGFWTAMITKANRKPATNNAERASLLKSMLAYSGKFTVDGDKITTAIDLTWNEVNTGRTQTRYLTMDGGKLVIKTPEQASVLTPGKRVVSTFTWEREH
jgi:hypothetical protein